MEGPKNGPNQMGQSSVEDRPPVLTEDQFYRALASKYRRRVLYCLFDMKSTTVEELATILCGWEATTTGTMQLPADRNKIHIALMHSHLPQLANAGLIEYDFQSDSVRLKPLHPKVKDVIRQSVKTGQQDES